MQKSFSVKPYQSDAGCKIVFETIGAYLKQRLLWTSSPQKRYNFCKTLLWRKKYNIES